MTQQTIISQDFSLGEVFQSFYNVPDYQREYVWGEADAKGERGDEVEHFLRDIHNEFEQATREDAPEYFIGTIVVCPNKDVVFDLIDGQQRTTTAFLVLCAIRDVFAASEEKVPETLRSQIASTSIDWEGKTTDRMRLNLQYEDAKDVLDDYGHGALVSTVQDTRSIRNLANSYAAIREFLRTTFGDDADRVRKFYGYFINKVKLIRIQTPDVSRALKIFETINERGVGLDAMDLLKNLLFMSAPTSDYAKLKDIWKDITQEIYQAGEKPLRFLRYYLMATYDVDAKLREEEIYSWLVKNERQTGHASDPLAFAKRLRDGAAAYKQFVRGCNPQGEFEHGVANTRALGGSAIKQHFVLLLAGRHLEPGLFTRLAEGIEQVMFVWLISGVSAKDYERLIAAAANTLRGVRTKAQFDDFETHAFTAEKRRRGKDFYDALLELYTWDLRKFRMKYLLAKLTQHIDIEAYGKEGRQALGHYLDTRNDVEHVLPQTPSAAAASEFGPKHDDPYYIQSLGNLIWLERSINRVIGNAAYSSKITVYPTSQFLLARCQAAPLKVGVNDSITRTMNRLNPAPVWNKAAVDQRQEWMADRALEIWGVPS